MLFYKTIKNCVKQSRFEYNSIMLRRGNRLLEFIEHDVPKFIVIAEINLLREPFYKFFINKYMRKIYENTRRVV